MFAQSFSAGLALWKFPAWLALVAAWLLYYYLYSAVIRLLTNPKESVGAAAPGCLVQLIGVLLQSLAVGILILLALPILLGLQEHLSFDSLASFLLLATRAGMLAGLGLTVLMFIPGVNRLLAGSPGFEAFLLGGAIFALSAPLYWERISTTSGSHRLKFPGFLSTLGYLATVFFLSKIIFLAWNFFKNRTHPGSFARRILDRLGPMLDLLAGIFVLSAYATWVKLSSF